MLSPNTQHGRVQWEHGGFIKAFDDHIGLGISLSVQCSNFTWATWPLKPPLTNVFSTACSYKQQRSIKCFCHYPLVRGIHQGLVDSPHKGSIILKLFPCHVMMSSCFDYHYKILILKYILLWDETKQLHFEHKLPRWLSLVPHQH